MIAGTTTWGSKLQICAMHITATRVRPCNGLIAEHLPLQFRILMAVRIRTRKRQPLLPLRHRHNKRLLPQVEDHRSSRIFAGRSE